MDWYLAALRKYVDFNGRARRSEYWWFTLINTVAFMVLSGIGFALIFTHVSKVGGLAFELLGFLWSVAHLLPAIGVSVRRLHDTGKSGWILLITLIPVIGLIMYIVLLVFFCMDSTPGTNQFGENPKGVGAQTVV